MFTIPPETPYIYIYIYNFLKTHPVGAEVLHAGEQTDVTKLIIAFRDFTKALNKPYTTSVDKP
jgi:hypothetical protein